MKILLVLSLLVAGASAACNPDYTKGGVGWFFCNQQSMSVPSTYNLRWHKHFEQRFQLLGAACEELETKITEIRAMDFNLNVNVKWTFSNTPEGVFFDWFYGAQFSSTLREQIIARPELQFFFNVSSISKIIPNENANPAVPYTIDVATCEPAASIFLDEELAAIFNALPNNNDTKQAQSHLYFLFNNSISFTSENKYKYYAVVYDVLTSYGLASPMLSNVTDSAVMEENGVTAGSKTDEFLQLTIAFYCDIFMTYSSGKVITAAQSSAFFTQIDIEWNFLYAEDKKKVKQSCPGFTDKCEKKGKKLKGGSESKNKKASHGSKSKSGSSEKSASKEWDGTCNTEDQSNIAYYIYQTFCAGPQVFKSYTQYFISIQTQLILLAGPDNGQHLETIFATLNGMAFTNADITTTYVYAFLQEVAKLDVTVRSEIVTDCEIFFNTHKFQTIIAVIGRINETVEFTDIPEVFQALISVDVFDAYMELTFEQKCQLFVVFSCHSHKYFDAASISQAIASISVEFSAVFELNLFTSLSSDVQDNTTFTATIESAQYYAFSQLALFDFFMESEVLAAVDSCLRELDFETHERLAHCAPTIFYTVEKCAKKSLVTFYNPFPYNTIGWSLMNNIAMGTPGYYRKWNAVFEPRAQLLAALCPELSDTITTILKNTTITDFSDKVDFYETPEYAILYELFFKLDWELRIELFYKMDFMFAYDEFNALIKEQAKNPIEFHPIDVDSCESSVQMLIDIQLNETWNTLSTDQQYQLIFLSGKSHYFKFEFEYYAYVNSILIQLGLMNPMLANVTNTSFMEEIGATNGTAVGSFFYTLIKYNCDMWIKFACGESITVEADLAFNTQFYIGWKFLTPSEKKVAKENCHGFFDQYHDKKKKKLHGGSKSGSHGKGSKSGSNEKSESKEWDGSCNEDDSKSIVYYAKQAFYCGEMVFKKYTSYVLSFELIFVNSVDVQYASQVQALFDKLKSKKCDDSKWESSTVLEFFTLFEALDVSVRTELISKCKGCFSVSQFSTSIQLLGRQEAGEIVDITVLPPVFQEMISVECNNVFLDMTAEQQSQIYIAFEMRSQFSLTAFKALLEQISSEFAAAYVEVFESCQSLSVEATSFVTMVVEVQAYSYSECSVGDFYEESTSLEYIATATSTLTSSARAELKSCDSNKFQAILALIGEEDFDDENTTPAL